nr:TRAP transporter large permease subunit [Polaromonas sp.]
MGTKRSTDATHRSRPQNERPPAELLVCMAIVMAAGYILEKMPVSVTFEPTMAPIAVVHGADPVHFLVIFLEGSAISFITSPFGLNLFVAKDVTGIPFAKLVCFAMMYLVGRVIAWLLIDCIGALFLSGPAVQRGRPNRPQLLK